MLWAEGTSCKGFCCFCVRLVRNVSANTHLSVCVIYTHCRVAVVSAAPCEPPPRQQTQENKEAGGSASGCRSSPLCCHSARSRRRRSQFTLLHMTDQETGLNRATRTKVGSEAALTLSWCDNDPASVWFIYLMQQQLPRSTLYGARR